MRVLKIRSIVNNVLVYTFILTAISCEYKKDPIHIADDHNAVKFNDDDKKNDSRFFVSAAEALLQEIQLAKLAQNNSIKNNVRKIGEITEIEYDQFYFSLKQIAEKKMITIPSGVSNSKKKNYKDLSYEIADDFDKKYFDMTEKGHKDAIDLFEKIKNESTDSDLKIWAENVLPTLRKNLGYIFVSHQKSIK
jgi:predicted outer membrane protein